MSTGAEWNPLLWHNLFLLVGISCTEEHRAHTFRFFKFSNVDNERKDGFQQAWWIKYELTKNIRNRYWFHFTFHLCVSSSLARMICDPYKDKLGRIRVNNCQGWYFLKRLACCWQNHVMFEIKTTFNVVTEVALYARKRFNCKQFFYILLILMF